jgi:hypothetical protein
MTAVTAGCRCVAITNIRLEGLPLRGPQSLSEVLKESNQVEIFGSKSEKSYRGSR